MINGTLWYNQFLIFYHQLIGTTYIMITLPAIDPIKFVFTGLSKLKIHNFTD